MRYIAFLIIFAQIILSGFMIFFIHSRLNTLFKKHKMRVWHIGSEGLAIIHKQTKKINLLIIFILTGISIFLILSLI